MTKFKTMEEFYRGIDLLAEKLRQPGNAPDADHVYALVHKVAWTTASELLGELALTLEEIRHGASREVRSEIDDCLKFTKQHRKILGLL